ncbi:hypothetical protein WJX73_001940 [Symbiochloris irregularis]|uniref:N-acetyltransferase domain-containing protein n=1 Tax=Symbiochloris irregularis TaxID=706552 RepID=A0AAW1PMV8_9CHLO
MTKPPGPLHEGFGGAAASHESARLDISATTVQAAPGFISGVELVLFPLRDTTSLYKEVSIPEGQVVVRPLEEEDVVGSSVLLSRAFAGSPEALTFNDVTKYYRKMLEANDWSKGLVLVARLTPTDPSILPKGRKVMLIGTMSISFDESTRIREVYPTPPAGAAYLTNMAIDQRFRRRGVASLLLTGGLEGARASGCCNQVYLHVRDKDTPALALYQKMGFESHKKESVPGGVFGMLSGRKPQTLMRIALEPL